MASRYCTNCGHPLVPGDNFCTGCGATISPNASGAVPASTTPGPAPVPSGPQGRGSNLRLLMGSGVVALVVLVVGAVFALNLLRGEDGDPSGKGASPPDKKQESASAGKQDTTAERTNATEETASEPKEAEEASPREEASGPASGYNRVQGPSGGLRVEVPSGWGVETGADSENEGGQNEWSYFAGEYLNSSITTAPSLDTWYTVGSSGAYMAASKALAQEYTDYELTRSLLRASMEQNCTPGPYEDLDRPPYTGKVQTWLDCYEDDRTIYAVVAAPEGRECVALVDAVVMEDEGHREAIEHILDTFEVDCGRVTSQPLSSPPPSDTATAVPSATAGATASPSASPESPPPSTGSDVDCDQVDGPIPTPPGDPNNLDGDGDGWACE